MNTSTRLFAFAAIAVTAAAGTASATTISSFLTGGVFHGVSITPATNPSGGTNKTYTVTLNAGAYVTYNSVDYPISAITGFYAMRYGANLSQPTLNDSGLFDDDNDHRSAGSIYGWKSNPNSGITAGNSHSFTFQTLSGDYNVFGFHISVPAGTFFPGTEGQTGNITGGFASVTPTPGAAAILGLGGLASMRRRRV
jgi:MYXO-CTERM domain-containing protein